MWGGYVGWGWGGGGGGITHPFLSSTDHQEKRRLCGLVALAESCWGKKDNYYPPSRAVTTMRHLRQLPPRSNQEVQCSVQTLFWPQSHALTTHLLLHMTASCAPKLWLLLES